MTAMSITILILLFQLESLVLDNNMLTTVVLEVNISHSILLLLCLGILIRSPPPTDHQQPLSRRLRFLSLLGNRLRCDCKVSSHHHHKDLNRQISIFYNLSSQSLWLRRVLESKRVSVFLPPCFSPFSRNTLTLQSFEGMYLSPPTP